jgi:Flp pilus assembly protein TadG
MKNIQSNQSGEKKSYRVLLLLIVGLAAFSSAMNELNQLQNLTLQAGRLMASWSETVMPTASANSSVFAASCVEQVRESSAECFQV